MRKIRGVRAAAHFEMIMAFVLFIGFVLFLFSIMKPYDERVLPDAALEGTFNKVQQEANVIYESLTLDLPTAPTTCVLLTLDEQLFEHNITAVKTSTLQGTSLTSHYDESTSQLHISSTASFFQLAFSDAFSNNEDSYTCSDTEITTYNLGGIVKREVLSLDKLQIMENDYIDDYQTLKNTLGVPPIYDFSLESTEAGISMKGKIPETGDVLAKEFIKEVLNPQTGELLNARFNLRLW